MFSTRRGFDDAERERLAAAIDAIYDDFVAKVAQGRGRPVADIEAVARGRVWTGTDAVDAGLVDRLGGLRDAVQVARAQAGLPDNAPVSRRSARPARAAPSPEELGGPPAGVARQCRGWPTSSPLTGRRPPRPCGCHRSSFSDDRPE